MQTTLGPSLRAPAFIWEKKDSYCITMEFMGFCYGSSPKSGSPEPMEGQLWHCGSSDLELDGKWRQKKPVGWVASKPHVHRGKGRETLPQKDGRRLTCKAVLRCPRARYDIHTPTLTHFPANSHTHMHITHTNLHTPHTYTDPHPDTPHTHYKHI